MASFKLIWIVLTSAVFGLFISIVLGGIAASGVITMQLTHILFWIAASLAVIGAVLAAIICSQAWKIVIGAPLITAIVVGSMLFGVDKWLHRKKAELDARSSPPSLSARKPSQQTSTESARLAAVSLHSLKRKKGGVANVRRRRSPVANSRLQRSSGVTNIQQGDGNNNQVNGQQIVSAPNGIAIAGGNVSNPTVNNYVPPQRTLGYRRQIFVDALRSACPFDVAVRGVTGNEESMRYAQEIAGAVADAGCTPKRPKFLIDTGASYGLTVGLHDPMNGAVGAIAIVDAFKKAGINVSTQLTDVVEPGTVYVFVQYNDAARQ